VTMTLVNSRRAQVVPARSSASIHAVAFKPAARNRFRRYRK
jgi:hypothetical protein